MSSSTGLTAFERLRSEKTRLIQSGYNKGTIRSDIWYLVVSKDVRRHRLISISYISQWRCHGRGREFESRRPRHSFSVRPLTQIACKVQLSRGRRLRTFLPAHNYTKSGPTLCRERKEGHPGHARVLRLCHPPTN